MLRIDRQLLVEIGLGHLDNAQGRSLQRRIYEVLAMRVGLALASSLTNAQLNTFETLTRENPEAAHDFLANTIPMYGIVARNELNFIARSIVQSLHQGEVVLAYDLQEPPDA